MLVSRMSCSMNSLVWELWFVYSKMIDLVANCDRFNSLKLFTARSYTYTELIYNNSSPTNWFPLAQQVLRGRRYRLLQLITLILPATSKGYSEDFLRKTDATMIVLTRRKDVTERSLWWYWWGVKGLVSFIASLWHNIAPYQGNNLPLPDTKRYVGSW